MKLNKLVLTGFMIFLMMFAAGCSGSEGNGPNDISDFEGTWDLIEFVYIADRDANVREDLLATQNMSVTMTIQSSGAYTITTTVNGQSFSNSGNFNVNDNDLSSPDPNVTVTLSGNTLTVESSDEMWDFGQGSEPADLRSVYQRR